MMRSFPMRSFPALGWSSAFLLCCLVAACGNHRRAPGAAVADLRVVPGELSPAFSPGHTEYTVVLPYGEDAISVVARAADPGSALSVDDIAVGPEQPFGPIALVPGARQVRVTVSGPRAEATRTYRIEVQRAPGLQDLERSSGRLRPYFAADVLDYDLDLLAPTLALTPRIREAGVRVQIDGTDAEPGAPFALDVALGDRTVPVTLVSADGKVARTYTLRMHRTTPTMVQEEYAKALDADELDAYGSVLASDGERIAVGVPLEDSLPDSAIVANDAGAVYVLEQDTARWQQSTRLKATNAEAFDLFGAAVGISGDTIVVGAPQEASDARGVNGDKFNNRAPNSGAAYVFVRAASGYAIEAYLKASNTGDSDFFGSAVAVSGDRIAVGAPGEASGARGVGGAENDESAAGAGAVYVFGRVGDRWVQEAYIKASNTGRFDRFGSALALSGDLLVVGAPGEDSAATGVGGDGSNNAALQSGAAYVYRVRNGIWQHEAYLKASNTDAGDAFGSTVAAHGDFVVVGAPNEASGSAGVGGEQRDNTAPAAGAAYVFRILGTGWQQQSYLKASNAQQGDMFGAALSLCGMVLVAGAPGEDGGATGVDGDGSRNDAPAAGAAYAFVRDGDTWFQRHYLKASNAEAGDGLGAAVAATAGWTVAGAPHEDSAARGLGGDQASNTRRDSGACYVFAVR